MIRLTNNIYVETEIVACNLGLITTKNGIVLIDTPIKPSDALKWKDEAGKRGIVRYLINTENHRDHAQSNYFLPGILVSSQSARENLSKTPVEEALNHVKLRDPESWPLMNGFKFRLADITFTDEMDLYLGELTLMLFSLKGHIDGGIGVLIPEEKVVFAGDIVFYHLKSWLQEAIPEVWIESLKKLSELDVEFVVGGHGTVCKKDYLKEQMGIIQGWKDIIEVAIKKGWSEEEALVRISQPDPYIKDPRTLGTEEDLNKRIIARLYKLYSGKP